MKPSLSPDQSQEIDDRIVEMIAAALGEGQAARRCRAIANERWLDHEAESKDPPRVDSEARSPAWQEIATAPVDQWVLTFCPHAQPGYWPSAPWIMARIDRGKWYDYDRVVVFPTHWMALTAPEPSGASVTRSSDTITASDVAGMASRAIRPMKRVLRP